MKYNFLFIIFSIFLLLNCKKSNEMENYAIYNTVLKEKVSTYGIMASYLPYDEKYSHKELKRIAIKISDSLIKSKSLTYFLDNKLTILDTLNPTDEFSPEKGNNILIETKPTYSKNKIDFTKINNLKIGKRQNLNIEEEIDENQKTPTYLGSYDLSEPVYINNENVVIKLQHYCGSKCGLGILIYLKKQNNIWKIIKEKEIWIS